MIEPLEPLWIIAWIMLFFLVPDWFAEKGWF